MSLSPPPAAEGQEVLVVDSDDKVLKGLERLLGDSGLIVTGTPDPARARDQVINKFFAVALCDIDTPSPGEGVELVRFVRERSPLTTVITLSPRKAFDAAVAAFRAGAADVVLKHTDSVPYLRDRVVAAAGELQTSTDRARLLEESGEVHEEFLQRMMDLSRQMVDLEDRVLGRGGGTGAGPQFEFIDAIVADDDEALFAVLSSRLTDSQGWRIRKALTGGEALDLATQARFQVAIVKESLPDLPGSLVVRTIKDNSPECIALLYSPPSPGGAGEVKMVDSSRLFMLIPAFSDPEQLITSLGDVREALQKKARERRYLQAFRQQHLEFIKRYHDLRGRIAKALQRPDPTGSPASIVGPVRR